MWSLVTVTFLEGVRSRILYGIFLFAVFVVFLSVIFSSFFMQDLGKVAVDFNVSAITFAGLLISASLSVNLISKDLDKRTIYFVLSRPISRTQYVWGKYLGLLTIFLFAYLLLTAISCLVLVYLKAANANYFASFNWLAYLQAIYFDFIKIVVFNAIIVLFGVITTSSFVNLLFSVSTYVVGQSISDVINFISIGSGQETVTPVVANVISVVKYIVPNFEAFDFKVISAHGKLISAAEFGLFTLYGLVYAITVLTFAVLIFKKKDLL
jgi:ABC-type transport system involved in multi-copper enzyme maturation permease subunit